jgi:2-dehydro-3-deoxygalactonokinase
LSAAIIRASAPIFSGLYRHAMKYFLSCDWGTTSFRLRLADAGDGSVLAEEQSAEGIAAVFDRWQQSGEPGGNKTKFYLDVLSRHIKQLEEKINRPLKGVKLIISGMASSTIGFIDIPYNAIPLPLDGSGLQTASVPADEDFEHDVLVISGVKTLDDVMRGEETQLIGCIEPGRLLKNELFIFPGTHSKHILVDDNLLVNFKTYMTGELFSLLAQKSILKNAVEPHSNHESARELDNFEKGVREAAKTNLLHAIFKVRTNELFAIYTKNENYNYLSGLLIGTELKALINADAETINLVCSRQLQRYYQCALQTLLPERNINVFSTQRADEAAVLGHLKIGNQLKIFA